jgi:predicted MPP superfamily phosphohydrolase
VILQTDHMGPAWQSLCPPFYFYFFIVHVTFLKKKKKKKKFNIKTFLITFFSFYILSFTFYYYSNTKQKFLIFNKNSKFYITLIVFNYSNKDKNGLPNTLDNLRNTVTLVTVNFNYLVRSWSFDHVILQTNYVIVLYTTL